MLIYRFEYTLTTGKDPSVPLVHNVSGLTFLECAQRFHSHMVGPYQVLKSTLIQISKEGALNHVTPQLPQNTIEEKGSGSSKKDQHSGSGQGSL